MLNSIVTFALRFKGIVLALASLVLGYGLYLSFHTNLDVFPDFVPPQVTIQTEAPGLSPEEVETLITFPLESVIGGIAGLETTRSNSIQGLSVIDVIFKDGTDQLSGRQLLSERLSEALADLPAQAKAPTMSPMVSSTMDLLKIGLLSEKVSPRELRTIADWTVRPRLKAVPGVAEVTVVGGESEELQILPDPERMAVLGISFSEIISTASQAIGIRGAGYIETRNQRLMVHAHTAEPDPDRVGATVIKGSMGETILLRDVADIRMAAMPKFGDALINGKPGVLLAMTSQHGANTLSTTREVEKALQELEPFFGEQGIELVGGMHRPANFIEIALLHLKDSLLIGGILVAVVLVIFLLDLRTAFISFISIPLSLFSAIIVMHLNGMPLDTMTLGGLAVAVGVVVDDAIIDVENIMRRLRENAALDHPRPILEVIRDASLEVRASVLYATFVVVAVFIPVFALSGLQGRFFIPLAISFVLAVAASLVTALTVVPALSMVFLRKASRHREPFYVHWMKTAHSWILRRVCRHPLLMTGFAIVLVALTFWKLTFLPSELLPPFREGHFVLQAFGIPGSSLEETMRFGKTVSDHLLAMPEIASVEMQAGRSEKGVDTWGPERCEFHVELKPDPTINEAEIQDRIREYMENFGNFQTETLTFLGDRIGESLSGETAAVVISVFGSDLDALDTAAQAIDTRLKTIPGATEVHALGIEQTPGVEVALRTDRLEQTGLRPMEVLDTVQTAFQGTEVAQLYMENRILPVTVRLGEDFRKNLFIIPNLLIPTQDGNLIRLGDLAQVFLAEKRATISHEEGRRRQVVTCNVNGRSVASFVAEAKKTIAADVKLPQGVYLTYGGAAEAEAVTHREFFAATLVTLVLIGIFLSLVFRSWKNLLLVSGNLPFAVAGGVIAIWISGLPVSLGALVGFITLLGLSTRNSIMLMTHYEHLIKHEGKQWNFETVMLGARERIIPVIMTAAVTGLAITPLALAPTSAGREIEGPMAVVILGGLMTSTLVTLILLPALAHKFAMFREEND